LTDVKQASMGHDQAGEMSTIAALDVDPCKLSEMMVAVKVLLRGLGEDVTRDGLLRTPLRVAQAFQSAIKGRFSLCLSVSVSLSPCCCRQIEGSLLWDGGGILVCVCVCVFLFWVWHCGCLCGEGLRVAE
jgi:hypothetical protein